MNEKMRSLKKRICKKQDIPLYFMAAPAVILMLLFNYAPMTGLVMAFKKYNVMKGIWGSEFIGLRNFEILFSSSDAFVIVRNTVVFNVVFIAFNVILAICLSLVLNELHSKLSAKLFQTVFILPHFLSWAVVAILVMAFLDRSNGLVNQIRNIMGLESLIDWYRRIEIWPPLLIFLNAWKHVGYQAVMYIAVISGISSEYYEAAVLDGATRFQQAKYITLPHLRTIISISLIMNIGSIFRGDFGLFYTVTQDSGALYPVTNVIDTYVYRGLLNNANIGVSTAVGLFQSLVGLIFILIANKIVSKIDPNSAMF